VLGRSTVELMTREVTDARLAPAQRVVLVGQPVLRPSEPGVASPASPAAYGHGGVSGTRLWIDPAHDLVLVYLTGKWGGARDSIDAALMAVYAALA
jgi:CubicO group peptidase (beta-lactamase class C family)